MKAQQLKGHLDMLVLAILAEGPRHGYAVIELLKERSEEAFDLPEGTVYPVLHRLEKTGLLSSTWSTGAGRPRRTYNLTASGREALCEQAEAWTQFVKGVSLVIGGAPWPAHA